MNLKEVIETTDSTIGPSLWALKSHNSRGVNPGGGHVYEVLGMADYVGGEESGEQACVVRSRSPIAHVEDHGLFKRLYFIGPEERGGGEPRAWLVERYESFVDRFEEVDPLSGLRGEQFMEELRAKAWSVFRLP